MSLHVALKAVGLLVVGYLVFVVLLSMGPIGLLFFGLLLVIGLVQVYRNRTQSRDPKSESGSGPPNYCPNCGSAIDADVFDRENASNGEQWAVRYCPNCSAPLESGSEPDDEPPESGSVSRTVNCPDCGAPNDADRTACKHCNVEL